MLDAANWAPSHGHTEPWRFTVFTGNGRQKLADAFGEAYRKMTPADKFSEEGLRAASDRVWQAPVWIGVVMQPDVNKPMPEWEDLIATGIAVHNMHSWLSVWDSVPNGAAAQFPSTTPSQNCWACTPLARQLGFIYVGKPQGEAPRAERKPLEHKVKWMTE